MLNDAIGVTKTELEDFLENIDNYIIVGKEFSKHKDISAHDSISLKTDKYIYEVLLNEIRLKKPKNGENAEKSLLSHSPYNVHTVLS